MIPKVRIVTRGSKLALWQANFVAGKLQQYGLHSKLNIVSTQGDRVQDRFLHELGGKGLFIRELEQALLKEEADVAVHSLKDLPAKVESPFALPAILQRHSPCDVIIWHPRKPHADRFPARITRNDVTHLSGLKLATSSLRRQMLFRHHVSRIDLVPIRGNVDTRIRKLGESQDWDGIVLAQAAIQRLGLTDVRYSVLDPEWFIPSPAQGALAIETLEHSPYHALSSRLNDPATSWAVTVERGILAALGGDCTMPMGAYVAIASESAAVNLRVVVLSHEAEACEITVSLPGPFWTLQPETVIRTAMDQLSQHNLSHILSALATSKPQLGTLEAP